MRLATPQRHPCSRHYRNNSGCVSEPQAGRFRRLLSITSSVQRKIDGGLFSAQALYRLEAESGKPAVEVVPARWASIRPCLVLRYLVCSDRRRQEPDDGRPGKSRARHYPAGAFKITSRTVKAHPGGGQPLSPMRASVDPMTRLAWIPPNAESSPRLPSDKGAPSRGPLLLDVPRALAMILARGPSSACMAWKTRRIKLPQGALFLLLLDANHAMNGRAKEPHDQLSLYFIQ
jgi:hypothetical protein